MPATAFAAKVYTSLRRIRRAACATGVTRIGLAWGLLLVQACNASDAVVPEGASGVRPVNLALGSAVAGSTLDAPVRMSVTGADGRPSVGVRVLWTARDGGSLSVPSSLTDANGIATVRWTLGTVAGPQSLIADVAGLTPVVFGATAVPDRPAVVRFNTDEARLRLLGDTVRVQTQVFDRFGNVSPVAPVLSLESGTDVVTLTGNALVARRPGAVVLRALADTASARLPVRVEPAPPIVVRVSPDTLSPGGTFAVEGANFALLPEAAELWVGSHRASITRISATRVEATLPASIPCAATATAMVRVVIASASAELPAALRTATRVSLVRGESANLLDPFQTACTEIVAPADGSRAKYVLAVINTSVSAAATSGFELRGYGAGGLAGRVAVPILGSGPGAVQADLSSRVLSARPATLPAALQDVLQAEGGHGEHLESQRVTVRRHGSPAGAWSARRKADPSAHAAEMRLSAGIGDTVIVKAVYSSCSKGTDIRARVVYTGSRSIMLEDIAAPHAGRMDRDYRDLGDEFERVQYPLLRDRIGDPLAMNATMAGDGRVTMLFTRWVNDTLPGIGGFVSACNFYPRGTFAASNEDEVVYARVPAASETPDEWRRSMRSTIVHESKHLASFAERFLRSTPFEEAWLEESTARIAEELYSRTFENGGAWKSNVGYTSVRCEVTRCDTRPLMMWKHFSVLHQYMRGVDTLTPIGAAASGDFTYYASGWSLVRWAADHYATNEGEWLKELVRGGQLTGLSNLASRTGRPAVEMLADWALATAVDDLPGFAPKRAGLSLPSWNTADVMGGLASSYPGMFLASPLKARAMSFGSFTVPVTRLRAFSSSYFSFEGAQGGSQVVELRGEGGAALPPAPLRVAVVRVE